MVYFTRENTNTPETPSSRYLQYKSHFSNRGVLLILDRRGSSRHGRVATLQQYSKGRREDCGHGAPPEASISKIVMSFLLIRVLVNFAARDTMKRSTGKYRKVRWALQSLYVLCSLPALSRWPQMPAMLTRVKRRAHFSDSL